MTKRPAGINTRLFRRAIVSIHDVTPETLSQVHVIILFLQALSVYRFTLLVVPGKNWTPDDINQLKAFRKMGGELAGHGFQHIARRMDTPWHQIHGKLISRNEAEHLSLTEVEIADIIRRSHAWFSDADLPSPDLYVPPAWAMGNIRRERLQDLPYRFYEYQSGVYDCISKRFSYLPVTGYLADEAVRIPVLKGLNLVNMLLPYSTTRIAIHPHDLKLPLKNDLIRHLKQFRYFLTYSEIIRRNGDSHLAPVKWFGIKD